MQDLDQLPLEQWASQLKAAREAAGIEVSGLAQDLLLSQAQLRCLETGSLTAFHGPGYYLRAVEKYAQRLGIVLDPPVTELKLSDSQLALKRVKNSPSAGSIAKNHAGTLGSNVLPTTSNRSRIGLWLGVLLIALVGVGTWMAIDEGWPNGANGNGTAVAEPSDVQTIASESNQSEPPNQDTVPAASADSTTAATEQETSDLFGSPLATNTTTAPTADPDSESANPINPQAALAAGAVSAPESAPEPAPEPPPAPPPPDVIQATFNADCWVEIRRIDGTTEQGIYKPGQSLVVDVADMERLTFGNAAAVDATRAGQPFNVLDYTRGGNNVARISKQELD